jgi:2-polyprenyl-6-methoxyphenol hydroxylase-like FAD-dependent oxidoreductase
MFDVIIVGARCAGASLAYFLGLYGYQILLIDTYEEPAETTSTHILGEIEIYERLGIRQKMETAGAPLMTRMRVDLNSHVFESDLYVTARAIGLRRELLDGFLLEAAESLPSVTTRLGTKVDGLIEQEGRIVGVTCQLRSGGKQSFFSKVVVGADGRDSTVARAVKSECLRTSKDNHLSVRYIYACNVDALPIPTVEWYWHGEDVVICNPIDRGLHCIALMAKDVRFQVDERSHEQFFRDYLSNIRTLAPRVKNMRGAGRIRGIGSQASYMKQLFGNGWVLVGDSGSYLHPIAGVGIDNAVCMAEVLAEQLHGYFHHEKTWLEAMSEYDTLRNERIEPQFESCLSTLSRTNQKQPAENIESLKMLCTFPGLVKQVGQRAFDIISLISEE